MRLLLLVLLLVNVAYLGWQLHRLEPQRPAAPVRVAEPSHVNRLLLLSEIDTAELRERTLQPPAPVPDPTAAPEEVAVAAVAEAPEPGVDPSRLCYSAGPLVGDDEVDAMRTWLAQHGGAALLREGERREIALYWVYFPPLQEREVAEQRVSQMRLEGIEDIYIIPRGDMTNAISLGVYSQRISLERRLRELKGYGYEPSIVPRYRNKKASWFDVEFPPDFRFPAETFADTFPAVELAPVGCPKTSIAATDRLDSVAAPDTRRYLYSDRDTSLAAQTSAATEAAAPDPSAAPGPL